MSLTWNDMPPEIKMMIIDPLDLASRYRVRGVAKAERELVDRMNYVLKIFYLNKTELWTSVCRGETPRRKYDMMAVKVKDDDYNSDTLTPVICFLLRIGTFVHIYVNFRPDVGEKICRSLHTVPNINTKQIIFNEVPFSHIKSFLGKVNLAELKSIILSCEGFEEYCNEELLSIPAITVTKDLNISDWNDEHANFTPDLIKIWLANDVEVGKGLWVDQDGENGREYLEKAFEKLRNDFESTVIQDTDIKLIRIATGKPDKCILAGYCFRDPVTIRLNILVVASDLKEEKCCDVVFVSGELWERAERENEFEESSSGSDVTVDSYDTENSYEENTVEDEESGSISMSSDEETC